MILGFPPERILAIAVALVVGITFHEFSHAFVADQLGDHRPRALGRVSLNPARHIEPMGALLFLLAGFGWGRPVPVNVYALRGGQRSMALVSAAGPLANVVVALAFAIPLRLLLATDAGPALAVSILFDVVLFNPPFYPGVPRKRPLDEYGALIDNSRAREVLGFSPTVSWRDEIDPATIPDHLPAEG